jgi:hypothetical protein
MRVVGYVCVNAFSHDFCLLRSSQCDEEANTSCRPKAAGAALSDGSYASIRARLWALRSACGQKLDFS